MRRKYTTIIQKRTCALLYFSLLTLSLIAQIALPTSASSLQTPPDLYVNHQTKECALFYPDSVCTTCIPPEGWAMYSKGPDGPCPMGYTEVEIKPYCYSSKSSFCCTEGHSGAPGLCKDMVINRSTKQCAFVDDIDACATLPKGWQQPNDGTLCPFKDYSWLNTEIEYETKRK